MGANDAKEQLEVAQQECVRLERENTALLETIRLGGEQLEAVRAHAVSLPDRETRERAAFAIYRLRYPESSAESFETVGLPIVLACREMVDAVLTALSTQPAADGAQLIAAERERQITEEGYTADKDIGLAVELTKAAQSYVGLVIREQRGDPTIDPLDVPVMWPWAARFWKPAGKPVRDLTKAGALIAAAIDSISAELIEVQLEPAPELAELFHGTLAALDRLSIRPEVQP